MGSIQPRSRLKDNHLAQLSLAAEKTHAPGHPGHEGNWKGMCIWEDCAVGEHPQNSADPGLGLPLLS